MPGRQVIQQRQPHGGAFKGEPAPFPIHRLELGNQRFGTTVFQRRVITQQEDRAHLLQSRAHFLRSLTKAPPLETGFFRRQP